MIISGLRGPLTQYLLFLQLRGLLTERTRTFAYQLTHGNADEKNSLSMADILELAGWKQELAGWKQ